MLLITGINHLNCVPYEVLHGLVLENNRFSAVRHRTPDFMRAPAILNYLTPYSVRQLDFILPEVPRYTDSLSLMKSSTSIWDTIDHYCARGEMENRIKEQQLELFADRTSTHYLKSNQLRLWLSSVAYVLMNEMRRLGLSGTEMEQAQCGTIRLKLLKIGAQVQVTVRRVIVRLASSYPFQELFLAIYRRLRSMEPLRC